MKISLKSASNTHKKCPLQKNGKATIDNRSCLALSFLVLPLRLLYQPRMDFILLEFLQNGVVPLLTSVSEKQSSILLKIVTPSFKHWF